MEEFLKFSFNEKSSALLFFFSLGLVFSLLLFRLSVKHDYRAGKWLGSLLLIFILYITPHMCGYAGWYGMSNTRTFLFFVPFMQVFLIGPVVYFYTKSLLNLDYKLRRTDLIHFAPAAVYFIYSAIVFVYDFMLADEYYFYADGRDKDLSDWYQLTGLTSMVFYLIISLQLYRNYRKRVHQEVSYADSVLYQWIGNFMIAFLSLLILRIMFFIINPDWGQFGSQFWYYLSFSIVFTYVAIAGYSHVIRYITLTESGLSVYNVLYEEESIETTEEKVNSQAENRPLLNEEEIENLKQHLTHLMSEKELFRNARLTLSDVAREMGTSTKVVSAVVNNGFDMNFNDFVNTYRIESIKQRMRNGDYIQQTLLGIALDAGFNSKATFNRAFKKITSLSPKDYLEQIEKD